VPLVVFSHGDLGCGLQSVAFTEELARHGYVVAAPDHADAFLCHTVPPAKPLPRPPQPDLFKPETWSDATFADRRHDIVAVIDGLLSSLEFHEVIDAKRIGAAGHSLGGYTVVGMAGGWGSWLDTRIRAVLAMSPYVMPFQAHKTLGDVRVPLMYEGGTLDIGITPFLTGPKGAYARASLPVYFLELKNAAHFAWVNCGKQYTTASCLENTVNARLIDEYGVAFFDRYLRDIPEPILSKKDPPLAEYEFRVQ
jgi:predicted dienelactone hydrolase